LGGSLRNLKFRFFLPGLDSLMPATYSFAVGGRATSLDSRTLQFRERLCIVFSHLKTKNVVISIIKRLWGLKKPKLIYAVGRHNFHWHQNCTEHLRDSKKEELMKKMIPFLIIALGLALVSAIALPGNSNGTSTLGRASNSLWKAIQAGAAMEPVAALAEVPTETNQR